MTIPMTFTQPICVGVSLLLALLAGHQPPSTTTLSGTLRAHVQDERFGIVTSIRGLPLGVRDGLQTLFETASLDIAEPNAEFQATDVMVTPRLPSRRLIAAGCSADHCLVYYERGGFVPAWFVTLFHWTPAETRFEWGGAAGGGYRSIGEVQKAILSGEIKSSTGSW
jgi:hypothetical protein